MMMKRKMEYIRHELLVSSKQNCTHMNFKLCGPFRKCQWLLEKLGEFLKGVTFSLLPVSHMSML
jgi:hypothetical protein